MNKEVIYLEPEDDITDILTKLQQAEQKLVALVPPKKAITLRSAVNMKLVARVAKECEKVVVVVTTDPAIVKMAMAARIPVAKTLQSRPIIPTEENVKAAEALVEVIDGETGNITTEKPSRLSKKSPKSSESDLEKFDESSEDDDIFPDKPHTDLELDDKSLEKSAEDENRPKLGAKFGKKKSKNDKKSGDKKPLVAPNIKKLLVIGIPAILILVTALVWAFVFAPSATIAVSISSTTTNVAENVRFTTNEADENIPEGVFFVKEQKLEQKYDGEFSPSGKVDKGEKASGTISVSVSFIPSTTEDFSYSLPVGTTFTTASGLEFVSDTAAEIVWAGNPTASGCPSNIRAQCTISRSITVTAAKAGKAYNIAGGTTAWSAYQGLTVSNALDFSGGTSNMVDAVSDEDVAKAAESIIEKHSTEGRKYLYEDVGSNYVTIEGSFKAEAGESKSSPAVGEEIKEENTKATLTVAVNYSVLTVEKAKIEEFVRTKLGISENQRLYSIGNPYFERFNGISEPAKLKTTIEVGPIVTEDEIFEKVKGHKTGEVQSILRVMDGVSNVEVRTPYFWVSTIPTDREKVTINVESEGGEES